jgi:hypothetical protein
MYEAAKDTERELNRIANAETLAGVPARVIGLIIANDPRYAGHKADGTVVLRDPDDGTETVLAVDDYLADHEIGLDEVFYATLDVFLSDVKGTTITPTEDVIDAMLDLRRVFQRVSEGHKESVRRLMDVVLARSEEVTA